MISAKKKGMWRADKLARQQLLPHRANGNGVAMLAGKASNGISATSTHLRVVFVDRLNHLI